MDRGRARDERKERQWRGLATPTFYVWTRTPGWRVAEKADFVPVQVVARAIRPEPTPWRWCGLMAGRSGSLRRLLAVLEERPC
jgi:hypothetical protein